MLFYLAPWSIFKETGGEAPYNEMYGVSRMTDGVDLLSHPPAADSTISAIKNDKNKNPQLQE